MWHVSSRSGVATLRTAIHLLLTRDWLCGACSEDHSGRQGLLHPWRYTAVREVRDAQGVHEGVCAGTELFLGRLQPMAAQVLSAQQLHRL